MSLNPEVQKQKLGLIAGGGHHPYQVIKHCLKIGRPFFVVGLEGQALPDLMDENIPHIWCRLGALGKMIETLKHEKVEDVVLIGSVKRPSFLDLRPDFYTAKLLARLSTKVLGDDALLSFLIKELEVQGFCVSGIGEVLSSQDLFLPLGPLGSHVPLEDMWKDIHHGIDIARLLGAVDVGQSIIMDQGLCLGVEAIEGTDALIKRCAGIRQERLLSQDPSGMLIKMCKPGQETRVDLPTIGLQTLENLKSAGFKGVVAEAHKTLLVDRDACRAFADKNNLFVIGVHSVIQGKTP